MKRFSELHSSLSHRSSPSHRLLQLTCIALTCVFAATNDSATTVNAQEGPRADERDLGIRLNTALAEFEVGQRVFVPDEEGNRVVAQLHLTAGEQLAVILPNGRLVAVRRDQAIETDEPFVAVEAEDLAAQLVDEKFVGFNTKTTRRYVYIYNTSEIFADATSRILETMYPGLKSYCRRLGIEVDQPATPLVVIMFRTRDEFQRYREMPPGVVAYYNSLSNYIVMYEQSGLAETEPMLAVKQSISTIAHEGVHQVLHNIGVQHRLSNWPAWISEGVPEFFAPTSVDRRIRWKGVGLVNDLRMHSLIELLRADDGSLGNGELVRQTVLADRLDANGYAAAWALTYYLAKHDRRDFLAYLSEVSQLTPFQEDPPSSEELFVKHFGDNYADIQAQMLARLEQLPYVDPIENQPHYVVLCQTSARRMSLVTTSPRTVTEWRARLMRELPANERDSAQFAVRVFENKTIAERAAASGF